MNLIIIGFGGIGSRLMALAKVDKFDSIVIYDDDEYETKNITRQGAASIVGRKKASIAQEAFTASAPHSPTVIGKAEKFSINSPAWKKNEPSVVFCSADNSKARTYLWEWSHGVLRDAPRAPDIVIYGMNELYNGEACLDIPGIPWWPNLAQELPNSFHQGADEADRPHCSTLVEQGGEIAEQTAMINATVAGDMCWLYQAAQHILTNPHWVTDPTLEIPLPYMVTCAQLVKTTRSCHAPAAPGI